MRAAWLTDIHLNFLDRHLSTRFLSRVAEASPDIVLLGGDIGEADSVITFLRQMERLLARPVYFVLGNHDFYGGSIASVRCEVESLTRDSPYLFWLNREHPVSLTPRTALIGHDSWADGRLGDFYGSSVELNDFHFIEELTGCTKSDRLKKIQGLADEAAEHLRRTLPEALCAHEEVILLTHVPPFREATWHEGRLSGEEWLPFFCCGVVGEVLKSSMRDNPNRKLTVLCGHTHGSGTCRVLPNLSVRTGGAIYGRPEIQAVFQVA